MRILFYISTIKGGGAARVMTNLANHFVNDSEMNNQVIFLTNFYGEQEYLLDKRVKRLSVEKQEKKSNFFIKNVKRVTYIRKIIKKENPDILISFMSENNIRAWAAALGLPVKVLISVRNDPNIKYGTGLQAKFIKYVYNQVDAIVFQTEEAKEWFGAKLKPASTIIMNQVSEEFYREVSKDNINNATEKTLRKDIVTTGKFLEQKNHKLLMTAFARICGKYEDNLIIYGDGKLRKEYEEYIQELGLEKRIQIPGTISKVSEHIKHAKLFVMSSDYEGMPNSLMEAMALGLPCISTDCPCGGPRALIESMKDGVLVKVGDCAGLANAMDRLMQEDDLRENIGRQAQIKAQEFRPEKVYKVWKEFIIKIGKKNEEKRK